MLESSGRFPCSTNRRWTRCARGDLSHGRERARRTNPDERNGEFCTVAISIGQTTLRRTNPRMSTELDKNKELIRRWIAFSNSGFAGSLDDFIAADYVGHLGAATMDRQELERLERQFCVAFPDAHHAVDDLIAEGDRVVLRTTARATHQGCFEGIDPTGRSWSSPGLWSTESRMARSPSRGGRSTSFG
jgi:predicted ester cyclase